MIPKISINIDTPTLQVIVDLLDFKISAVYTAHDHESKLYNSILYPVSLKLRSRLIVSINKDKKRAIAGKKDRKEYSCSLAYFEAWALERFLMEATAYVQDFERITAQNVINLLNQELV